VRRKHYHVLVGLPGCMPDSNDVCQTQAEAQDCAQWWAQQYREDWNPDTDKSYYKVLGNKRMGYAVIRRNQSDYAMPILISINDCHEEECFCDLSGELISDWLGTGQA